jgi:electron transfer flavoprotein beta subunit
MKILVCVKQVCDSAETVSANDSAGWITYGKNTVFRMNRYDEYAVEEALRIRERFGNTIVDALSVGPERVGKTIRRALEMGADHGIHVLREEDGYMDAFERASLIASVAGRRNYDLIFTGIMAEDDMESQVGGLVAEMLGYECATGVIFQEVSGDLSEVSLEREIEGGRRHCLTIRLPALLAVQSGINTPRYPALTHVLRARSAELECIKAYEFPALPSPQSLIRLDVPEEGAKGEFIKGTQHEKAQALLDILHEHSLL